MNEDDEILFAWIFFRCRRVPPNNNRRNGNWFLNDKVVGRRDEKEMEIVEFCVVFRVVFAKSLAKFDGSLQKL